LFLSLSAIGSYQYLNISRNSLEDEAFAAIGAAIKKNSTLAKLDVAQNLMGDKGARSLMEGLDTRKGQAALRVHFEGNPQLGNDMALRLRLMSERSEGRLRTKFRKAAIRGRETLMEMIESQRDAVKAQQMDRLAEILAQAGERRDTPTVGGVAKQWKLKSKRKPLAARRRKSIWKEEYVGGQVVQVQAGDGAVLWGATNRS
jgi:hypothetical protein